MKVLKGIFKALRVIIVTIFKTIFTIISAVISFCFKACIIVGILTLKLIGIVVKNQYS
ncbi:MAG: hypothetical protein R3Y35_07515 [Clostridia bacterium]